MPRGLSRRANAAAALVAMALLTSTSAHASTDRDVQQPYTGGGVQGVVTVMGSAQDGTFGGVQFSVGRSHRFVHVDVRDESGRLVVAEIAQLVDAEKGELHFLAEVCGGTEEPIPLAIRGAPVVVTPMTGACGPAPSAPTSGVVAIQLRENDR